MVVDMVKAIGIIKRKSCLSCEMQDKIKPKNDITGFLKKCL